MTLRKRVAWHGEEEEKKETRLTAAVFFKRRNSSAFRLLLGCGTVVATQTHAHMYAPRKSLHPRVFFVFFWSIACLTQAEREECVGLPGCCEGLPLLAEWRTSSVMHFQFFPSRLPVPDRMPWPVEPEVYLDDRAVFDPWYWMNAAVKSAASPAGWTESGSGAASALPFIQPTPLYNHGPTEMLVVASTPAVIKHGRRRNKVRPHSLSPRWLFREGDK